MKSVHIIELGGMYAVVVGHNSQFHKPVKCSLQPDMIAKIRDKLGETSAILLRCMRKPLCASLYLVFIYAVDFAYMHSYRT
jgi:hypothetical protein